MLHSQFMYPIILITIYIYIYQSMCIQAFMCQLQQHFIKRSGYRLWQLAVQLVVGRKMCPETRSLGLTVGLKERWCAKEGANAGYVESLLYCDLFLFNFFSLDSCLAKGSVLLLITAMQHQQNQFSFTAFPFCRVLCRTQHLILHGTKLGIPNHDNIMKMHLLDNSHNP